MKTGVMVVLFFFLSFSSSSFSLVLALAWEESKRAASDWFSCLDLFREEEEG